MNFLEMKNSSFQSFRIHQVIMKTGRPNQTGLSILFTVALLLLLIVAGCKNDFINDGNLNDLPLSPQELSEIDHTIISFYELKKDYALQFINRGDIGIADVYYSDEIKQAVRYKLLFLAEMGMIKEYAHDVQILHNEVLVLPNGELIVPGLEKVTSTTIPPGSGDKIESAYTDKLFFRFAKTNVQWKIIGIEILGLSYGIETKYNTNAVSDYIITDSAMVQISQTSKEGLIFYEERKFFEQLFDKKITESALGEQLRSLYKKNDLLPDPLILKAQAILNKANAVAYALKWTDNTGSSTITTSYNNSVYKSYPQKDCANFCSQCLKAGGWSYESPYKNSTSTLVWWYNNLNTKTTIDDYASNTWVGANALFSYVVPSKATSTSTVQAHAGTIGLADLLWIPKTGTKTHVMITTSIAGSSLPGGGSYFHIYISGHTNNRKNYNIDTMTDAVFGHFK
jgi:hypothetical protein